MELSTKPLSEWLHQLGCPVKLSHKELQKLNSLKMKSIWRHLKTCIKSKFPAQTVKKNLLLNKLNSQIISTQSTNLKNFKIGSIQELTLIEEIISIKEQVDSLENKSELINLQSYSSSSTLVLKNVEKRLLKDRLTELEDKSGLLELMAGRIKENITEMNKEITYLNVCQPSPAAASYMEMKQNQATVVKFVDQLSNMESEDGTLVSEIVLNTLLFSPIVILNGLLISSNTSVKSLNSKLYRKLWSHEQSSRKLIDVSLSNLNAEIVKNEIDIFCSSKEINKLSNVFENSMETLAKSIKEGVDQTTYENEEEKDFTRTVEFINDFLHDKRENTKNRKVRLLLEELFTNPMETDYFKSTVIKIGEKKEGMKKTVDEKVNIINELLQNIFDGKESIKLFIRSISKKHSELASNFFTEYNLSKSDENLCHIMPFKRLIKEEFELFQRIPLIALTRKWEDFSSILRDNLDEEFSKNSDLCSVIFNSELKNVGISLLERLYWFYNCDQQQTDSVTNTWSGM